MSGVEHIDVVWAEDRDEIFMNRLAEDIGKLQQVGFDDRDIKKMLGRLDYIRFWIAWPAWAFPADRLPKGCKWSEGVKYHRKAGSRSSAETYVFLPVGNDLYIKSGNGAPLMPGLNIREKTFLRIVNFRSLTANEFLQWIDSSPFFHDCILKIWRENSLRLGWAEPIFTNSGVIAHGTDKLYKGGVE